MNNLHERIAKALGWDVADVRTFSMHALREVVRPVSKDLAAEISEHIRSGDVLTRPKGDK